MLGLLAPDIEAALQSHGTVVRPVSGETLALALRGARVMLVSDIDDADGEGRRLIAEARESAPTMTLISINSVGPRTPFGQADISLDWPQHRDRLLATVDDAFAMPRASKDASGRRPLTALVLAGLFILLWQAIVSLAAPPPYLVPAPARVLEIFLGEPGRLAYHLGITAGEAVAGFILGNLAGIVTSILLYRWGMLQRLAWPVLTGLQAVPIVALAPLLALWLGTGAISKIAMATLICYFPVSANLLAAFASVDRELAQLFVFHRAGYRRTLVGLLLPSSRSALLSGLRISGGLAVVGAIVAEFTGSDSGLGYLLLNASYRLDSARLVAAILLAALLGLVFGSLPAALAARSRLVPGSVERAS